ncbi:MAG: DUF4124 domain-containing protein [Candidatus Cloacimonetes bacterium]|nr:DUF4124 domain-containing protein [Candidatus Cloacimonadota bacterium]
MRILFIICVVFFTFLSQHLFGGQIYRWTDSNGNTVMSDRPPTNGREFTSTRPIVTESCGSALSGELSTSSNIILKPFGNLEWTDNIVDVFRKIKVNPSIKEIYCPYFEKGDIAKITDSDFTTMVLAAPTRRIFTGYDDDDNATESTVEEYEHRFYEVISKEGKRCQVFLIKLELSANPIFLAGIPFRINIVFDTVKGSILTGYPEKKLVANLPGKDVLFLNPLCQINLTPLDDSLFSSRSKELFNIMKEKYPEMVTHDGKKIKNVDFESGIGPYNFEISNSDFRVVFVLRKEYGYGISYYHLFRAAEENYEKHRNSVLADENKTMDSSSDL